jgi:hypothetical protein
MKREKMCSEEKSLIIYEANEDHLKKIAEYEAVCIIYSYKKVYILCSYDFS